MEQSPPRLRNSTIGKTAPRTRRWLRRNRWRLIAGGSCLALALTTYGFWRSLPSDDGPAALFAGSLYKALLAFWFNAADYPAVWEVQVGRLIALAVAVTVGSNFILEVMSEEVQRSRARRLRNHIVICGLGELGASAAATLMEQRRPLAVVDAKKSASLIALGRRGVATIVGDATDILTLAEAAVDRASFVLVCCGDDDLNAAVAQTVRAVAEDASGRKNQSALSVRVHIDDLRLLQQLRPLALRLSGSNVDVDFFSVAEIAAGELVDATGLERGDNEFTWDAVVVGDTWLAERIVVELAQSAGLRADSQCIRILLASIDAVDFRHRLDSHYPGIGTVVVLEALQVDWRVTVVADRPELIDSGRPLFREAFVCLGDDLETMRVALNMTEAVRSRPTSVRVRACIYGRSGLSSLLGGCAAMDQHPGPEVASRAAGASGGMLQVFDTAHITSLRHLALLDTVEVLARAAHREYVAVEMAKGSARTNPNVVPWEELDDGFREANRSQVRAYVGYLDSIGIRIVPAAGWLETSSVLTEAEVDALARLEHDRWVADKRNAGWRQAGQGEARDDQRRIHVDMVAWDELDERTREKDRAPIRNMPKALALVGLRTVRVEDG